MNAKLILLSVFTVFYFLGSQWWYSNKIAGVCCGPGTNQDADMAATSMPEAAVLAVAPVLPIAFQWMASEPTLGSDFDSYKTNSVLNGMTEDNILQITGTYYEGEAAPDGYDNMGLARAAAVRDMLQNDIQANRVDISSRLAADSETMKDSPFDGVAFSWKEALKKEETTIVEVENESTIYFPFNSSIKDQNTAVDEYLNKLSERLKQTEEKVSIVGHTDDIGEDVANITLGMDRAASIRNILVSKGIAAERISIDSKGEAQPATTNETEDGRYRNRRTVLRIVN